MFAEGQLHPNLEKLVLLRQAADEDIRDKTNQNAVDITKSAIEGQGDAHFDAVGAQCSLIAPLKTDCRRGLDNAGKTTIVKKIMNEDVNSVSPTLGFIIKTIDYDGYVSYLGSIKMRC